VAAERPHPGRHARSRLAGARESRAARGKESIGRRQCAAPVGLRRPSPEESRLVDRSRRGKLAFLLAWRLVTGKQKLPLGTGSKHA
jgi:hypothetical protein